MTGVLDSNALTECFRGHSPFNRGAVGVSYVNGFTDAQSLYMMRDERTARGRFRAWQITEATGDSDD